MFHFIYHIKSFTIHSLLYVRGGHHMNVNNHIFLKLTSTYKLMFLFTRLNEHKSFIIWKLKKICRNWPACIYATDFILSLLQQIRTAAVYFFSGCIININKIKKKTPETSNNWIRYTVLYVTQSFVFLNSATLLLFVSKKIKPNYTFLTYKMIMS